MNIKSGINTWSDASQASNLKADKRSAIAPDDHQKHFGDQAIGEVLNKVVDPNWVDPSKTRGAGNSELDKDAFLKLFLAQLKNQDPMNPMESHDLSAQLAQFTSLEKLNNIDSGISKMNAANQPKSNFDALEFIGKAVSGDSSKILRTASDDTHDISFKLPADVKSLTARIFTPQGEKIREVQLSDLKKGQHNINWNGQQENGQSASEGEFRVTFEAKAANGKKILADTKFGGKITGVNFTAQGPVLMLGTQSVRLSEVKKIIDPALLKPAGPKAHQAAPQAAASKVSDPVSKASVQKEDGRG